MAWSRAFQKCIIYYFLDKFFCKHFCYITGFCDKKFNCCKFANFFADSKSRAQELSNDVSFVIFGHQTWDQYILVFKYPSRDRVNKDSGLVNCILIVFFIEHLAWSIPKQQNCVLACKAMMEDVSKKSLAIFLNLFEKSSFRNHAIKNYYRVTHKG